MILIREWVGAGVDFQGVWSHGQRAAPSAEKTERVMTDDFKVNHVLVCMIKCKNGKLRH